MLRRFTSKTRSGASRVRAHHAPTHGIEEFDSLIRTWYRTHPYLIDNPSEMLETTPSVLLLVSDPSVYVLVTFKRPSSA